MLNFLISGSPHPSPISFHAYDSTLSFYTKRSLSFTFVPHTLCLNIILSIISLAILSICPYHFSILLLIWNSTIYLQTLLFHTHHPITIPSILPNSIALHHTVLLMKDISTALIFDKFLSLATYVSQNMSLLSQRLFLISQLICPLTNYSTEFTMIFLSCTDLSSISRSNSSLTLTISSNPFPLILFE